MVFFYRKGQSVSPQLKPIGTEEVMGSATSSHNNLWCFLAPAQRNMLAAVSGKARYLTQLPIQKYALRQQCSKKLPRHTYTTRPHQMFHRLKSPLKCSCSITPTTTNAQWAPLAQPFAREEAEKQSQQKDTGQG